MSNAYNQFELEDGAKEILTISTTKGLFQQNRMPFGITTASGYFQRKLEQLFQDMKGVCVYQDDICITALGWKTHLDTLQGVLRRLKDAGLTVDPQKCEFFKKSVVYLGHRISKDGLAKTEDKVQAIKETSRPTNTSELRSLIGMVNFYKKFVPDMARILRPLYDLLKKGRQCEWSKQCETCFNEIKRVIASDAVLTHFNPNLPLYLSTDASNRGLAAVLTHRMLSGEERPIFFASRTLLASEQIYSTIHKECAAIHFGLVRFSQYLIGRKFTIRCDQKPFTYLLGERAEIPRMYENRLQRWAVHLAGFNYTIEHIKGKNNVIADYLFMAPGQSSREDEKESQSFVMYVAKTKNWPIDNRAVREKTQTDKELQQVIQCIKTQKWPKGDDILVGYRRRKDELRYEDGLLLWGNRIIVAKAMRGSMLHLLHKGHFSASKMKARARSLMFWPGMDKEI